MSKIINIKDFKELMTIREYLDYLANQLEELGIEYAPVAVVVMPYDEQFAVTAYRDVDMAQKQMAAAHIQADVISDIVKANFDVKELD